MKWIKRGTFKCQDCGTTVVMTILFRTFAFYHCWKCGCASFGRVKLRKKGMNLPNGDVVTVRTKEDTK